MAQTLCTKWWHTLYSCEYLFKQISLFQWISTFRSIYQIYAFKVPIWSPFLLRKVPNLFPFRSKLGPHLEKKMGPNSMWEQCSPAHPLFVSWGTWLLREKDKTKGSVRPKLTVLRGSEQSSQTSPSDWTGRPPLTAWCTRGHSRGRTGHLLLELFFIF